MILLWQLSLTLNFAAAWLISATVFNNANNQINVYGDDVEVDYRGYEVRCYEYLYTYIIFIDLVRKWLFCLLVYMTQVLYTIYIQQVKLCQMRRLFFRIII